MPSPLSLLIDLSASLYLGLLDGQGRVLAARVRESARGESAHDLLDEALREAGAGPRDLADIAVGIGPGSFTGIRVGVALAQGLAFAGKLPLHPFSSLAAMLACAPGAEPPLPAVAAIAAASGRWYVASGLPPLESLMTRDGFLAAGAGSRVLVTSGPVPEREALAAAFPALLRMEEIIDFGAVLRLAKGRPPVQGGVIRPNYLMASAAEEKRLGSGPAGSPG
jgi:tRNA threonylcarbamoyl adenosine modification protein YeaZ